MVKVSKTKADTIAMSMKRVAKKKEMKLVMTIMK